MQNERRNPFHLQTISHPTMQHPFFGTLLRLVVLCGSWSRASASFLDFLGVDFLESLYVLEFLLDPISMIRKRKIQCIVKYAFLRTGDYGNFDEYNRYFRDDSVMALKQTGIYKGADGIAEYFSVGFASRSPYLVVGPVAQSNRIQVLGYNSDSGQCEFLSAQRVRNQFNPEQTTSNAAFDNTVLFKLFLDYDRNYVTRLNLFFPETFLGYFFGLQGLSSPNAQSFICNDVLAEKCPFPIDADCIARISELPPFDAVTAAVDGNSIGCRAIHGYLATTSPDEHCPHVSLDPRLDPSGNIKCQTSDEIELATLFGQTDLSFFRAFQRDQGFDPDVGYQQL